jgi:hypothetical protein
VFLNSSEAEINMPSTPIAHLAASIKALARSVLFSLGVDHVLIDFLTCAAIGAATVLITIFIVGVRCSPIAIRRPKS